MKHILARRIVLDLFVSSNGNKFGWAMRARWVCVRVSSPCAKKTLFLSAQNRPRSGSTPRTSIRARSSTSLICCRRGRSGPFRWSRTDRTCSRSISTAKRLVRMLADCVRCVVADSCCCVFFLLSAVAGVEVGGVLVSTDAGATWHEENKGLNVDVHSVRPDPFSSALFAVTGALSNELSANNELTVAI